MFGMTPRPTCAAADPPAHCAICRLRSNSMALLSPAHRTPFSTAALSNAFDMEEPVKHKPQLHKSQSKLVVLEADFEDEEFCRPEDTEIKTIHGSLLKKQKSASVVPVLAGGRRESDRDIPTNEELEKLPIDLSFVLNDTDNADTSLAAPIPTPRHKALSCIRQQHSARLIQRRWRKFMVNEAVTDAEEEGEKTDLETDTEQMNAVDRSKKTRRRRIRKHRGRKKKRNN